MSGSAEPLPSVMGFGTRRRLPIVKVSKARRPCLRSKLMYLRKGLESGMKCRPSAVLKYNLPLTFTRDISNRF